VIHRSPASSNVEGKSLFRGPHSIAVLHYVLHLLEGAMTLILNNAEITELHPVQDCLARLEETWLRLSGC